MNERSHQSWLMRVGIVSLFFLPSFLSAQRLAQISEYSIIHQAYSIPSFSWVQTQSVVPARYYHTATLLFDGRVLVTGGRKSSDVWNSTVLFDPIAGGGLGGWVLLPPMQYKRERHTATPLANGFVVVTGGILSLPMKECEFFDALTMNWYPAPAMNFARFEHTATPLSRGRVLVVGSKELDRSGQRNCEILEPLEWITEPSQFSTSNWRWKVTDSLQYGRGKHCATRLKDGRILITGGVHSSNPTNTCEVFDPVMERWSLTPSMKVARDRHSAVLLPDGRVLVSGGDAGSGEQASCEIFDPQANNGNGEWKPFPSMNENRKDHTSTVIADRYVLVTGAWHMGQAVSSTEVLDLFEVPMQWVKTDDMNEQRCNHTATLLQDGRVLVIGGELQGTQNATGSCDVIDRILSFITGVQDEPAFSLEISPNVSTTSQTIAVRTHSDVQINLDIFDVLGKYLRKLYEGKIQQGGVSVVWDGQDAFGNLVSPGVYYCVATNRTSRSVQRIIRY